jgi:hypothetical protein
MTVIGALSSFREPGEMSPHNAFVLTGVAKFGLVGCTESPAYDR